MVKREREAAESLVGCTELESFGGVKVEEECGSVKSFNPIDWRHACLEKKGTNHVISGANDTFSFAVLGRGVWARHAEGDA